MYAAVCDDGAMRPVKLLYLKNDIFVVFLSFTLKGHLFPPEGTG